MQGADFVHQRVVDVQAAGGIDDEDVKVLAFGKVVGARGDVRRFFAGIGRNEGRADLSGQRFQLFYRCRTVHVSGNERDFFLFVDEFAREFGTRCSFPRALQTRHEDDRRRLGGEVERAVFFAHDADEFVFDGFDKGLVGREFEADFLADGGVFDGLDDFFDHWQGDVRLNQRHAHVAQGLGDVFFGDASLTAQFFEGSLQAFAKVVKHGLSFGLVT